MASDAPGRRATAKEGCNREFYNRVVLGCEHYIHRRPTLAIKGRKMNTPIKEGRQILARVMSALVDAPECYIPVRGPWLPLTEAQTANWEARQTISKLLREGAADLEEVQAAEEVSVPAVDTWDVVKDWTAAGAPIVDATGQGGLF